MPVLRLDRDVVLAAVAQNGLALEFAAPQFQADRAVVLAAVAQNGNAIQFAAAALKADRGVVLAAIAQNGLALRHLPERRAPRRRERRRRQEEPEDGKKVEEKVGQEKQGVGMSSDGYSGSGAATPVATPAVAALVPAIDVDAYMGGTEGMEMLALTPACGSPTSGSRASADAGRWRRCEECMQERVLEYFVPIDGGNFARHCRYCSGNWSGWKGRAKVKPKAKAVKATNK